jgi:hypothetical protein
MSNIVSIHLMGGLGNQLFQIFAVLSYCLEYDYELIMPYSKELTTGHVRNTYWDTFLSGLKKFTNSEGNMQTNELFSYPVLKEKGFMYLQFPPMRILQVEKMLFFGYFQSYKYFEKNQEKIFELMKLDEQKEDIRKKYFHHDLDVVSMHFRFGDYKKIQDCHPLMPIQYYTNALKTAIGDYKEEARVKILYFCEEEDNNTVNIIINTIKKLDIGKNLVFEKVLDNICDWEQMLLMSLCNHNIIANSSFSWWGAYFNTNKHKKVCYPALWFGPKMEKDVSDMFPPSWNKITF